MLTLCPGATDTKAVAKQGIDREKLAKLMSAREVACGALDAIGQGPTYFSSEHYRSIFEHLLDIPRRDALRAMASSLSR